MEDERLIEAVRIREFLYNLDHAKYMDAKYKNNAWIKIAKELNQPVPLCKSRWANLRDAFRKFDVRHTRSGQGADTRGRKEYKYGKKLEFLRPFMKMRQTLFSVHGYPPTSTAQGTTATATTPTTTTTLAAESSSEESDADREDWQQPSTSNRGRKSTDDNDERDEEVRQQPRTLTTRNRKRKARDDDSDQDDDVLRNFEELNRLLRGVIEKKESHIELYGRSVIAAIMALDAKRQMLAKKKFQEFGRYVDELLMEKLEEEANQIYISH